MTQPSAACCQGTPISLHGPEYKLTGEFIEIDETKYYVTGPTNATSAILLVYDIFGFWTQTLLGADILSATKTSSSPQGIRVFVPDFFGPGNEADIAYWPANTEEKWDYILKVFEEQAEKGKNMKKLGEFMNILRERDESKNVNRWGVAGYCWGAKIVTLASQEGTIFKAGAQAHPSLVDPEDAKLATIPQIVLLSKDEDKNQCKAYENNLKVGYTMLVLMLDLMDLWRTKKFDMLSTRDLAFSLASSVARLYLFRGLITIGTIDELVNGLRAEIHKPMIPELVKLEQEMRADYDPRYCVARRQADTEAEERPNNELTDAEKAKDNPTKSWKRSSCC
ncbi:hypothetical protein SBOR_8106 [Sclerotinia borealis F-4128]|uniref:Dienelactone hydrolase domain-containing protein n=1 Tax=Sclerotinia borealis (strain F-4128) TaxID=1432307 RepID=W9C6Y6_SCLBF|nr:hypothetical protein SBOR_8106 [Sclerotinia borealis F-4128]